MLDLLIAAALAQAPAPAPDPCYAVGAPPPARCPAWRSHYRDALGEMSADPASLRRDGASFEIRARVVFAEANEIGARTILGTYRYDCGARTATLLHFAAYDADGAALGEADADGENARTEAVSAGSPNEALLDAYCER